MFHIDPATCGYIWPKTKGNTQVAPLVANMLCEVSDELHSNEISIVRLKSSYHICFFELTKYSFILQNHKWDAQSQLLFWCFKWSEVQMKIRSREMQKLKLYLDTSLSNSPLHCISYIPQIVVEQLQLKFISTQELFRHSTEL